MTKKFLISIQWGKGHHYFIGPAEFSKTVALRKADGHARRLKGQLPERGALPTVRVLQVIVETPITRSNL